MEKKAKPVPDGYQQVTPYLFIKGAARALEFYSKAFGARERMRISEPGGDKVGHAEIEIGTSVIMLADEYPAMDARSPLSLGGSPVGLHLYVEDVDAVVRRAIEAGARLLRPVENQFYGDRSGTITDPFGHIWYVATHVEDIAPDELERRAAAAFKSGA